MRPQRDNIAAPVLPPRLRWLNAERAPVLAELTAAGPVLVHFFDFAQLNSVRALPYAVAWTDRYRDAGLATLGRPLAAVPVHGEADALAAALARLGVEHPVCDDSSYAVWHDYGCAAGRRCSSGARAGRCAGSTSARASTRPPSARSPTELVAIDRHFEAPADARASAPRRRGRGAGRPAVGRGLSGRVGLGAMAGGADRARLRAGGAHASVAGEGRIEYAIDDGASRELEVGAPGLFELAQHPTPRRHGLRLEPSPGVELYSVSFSAGLP